MKEILIIIKQKGLIEFIYLGISILSIRVFSVIRVIILRFRGYDINFSVILGGANFFFQGNKKSIKIDKNSRIGFGVRLEAGFDGKIILGRNVLVHDYSIIYAHKNLIIGDNTMISPHVFITDYNHKYPHSKYKNLLTIASSYEDKETIIGKNVWIGANAIILPGVNIGDDSVIGAGSVVTKNIPKLSIVVGVPARIVKKISNE